MPIKQRQIEMIDTTIQHSQDERPGAPLLASRRCSPTGNVYLYSLTAVASIGGFLFGYDTGVVSGAMALIRAAWNLNDVQHEAIVSSTTGLAAIGAMSSGTANRLFGRKPVLLAAAVVFTIGAVVMGIAQDFGQLLVGRCIVGYAIGFASSTVPLYLAELAPANMRGLLVSVNNSCIVIGQVSAAIVDGLLSGAPNGWRWMLGLGGVPSVIQFVGLLCLPESPRWLISRGKTEQARIVLQKLRRGAPELEQMVDAEVEEIQTSLALANGTAGGTQQGRTSTLSVMPQQQQTSSTSTEMAAPPPSASAASDGSGAVTLRDLWEVRKQLILGVGLLTLQQLIGINTIMYYSVSILLQAKVASVQMSIWLAVPVAAAQLVGCLIGGALIDRVGRRPLVLFSLTGAAVSLALEGAAFTLDGAVCELSNSTTAAALDEPPLSPALKGLCGAKGYVTVGAMVLYLLCFGIGMSPVPWAINSEIYPLRVRTACVGIATAANWITNFIVAATFLSLQDLVSKPGAFWLYGGVAVLGAIWLWRAMPETAGRSLEQIEAIFDRRT